MSKSNYWKYYIGIDVPCANLSVSPKPVRLLDWEIFQTIAYEPLRINEELMRKQLKIDESVSLYEYLVKYMMEKAKNETGREEYGLIILAQIFTLAFRLPIELKVEEEDGTIGFVFCINGNENDIINKHNYPQVREMIMEQNLIFEPLVAPNKKSQEAIDKAIERKKNSGSTTETNIESMIVLVSKGRKIDEDYTFYQLQADYEMELRLEQSRAIPVYRAVGADIEPIVLAEVLSMHEDPYSFDKMFKKNDRQKDNLSQ